MELKLLTPLLCFLAALLTWTFIEYAMHHWLFHRLKLNTVGRREHLTHHSRSGYFTPHALKARLALTVGSCVFGITGLLLGLEVASYFTLFFGLSYGVYERVHYLNHAAAPRSWYGRWARKHHFAHHFHDARMNHGVTSPIWDIIFRTYRHYDKIAVPRRFAMDWLTDEIGEVKSSLRDEYRLR